MRNSFGKTITELALNDKRIVLLIGDTGSGVFDDLKKCAPDQFINAGIAEANMVTVAAGLARAGFIPFVYAIGPHLVYRAYEQIRNDLCLNFMNVKLVSVGSGLHYADHGPTHHSTEDFGVLRVLPNMKIFSPSGDYDTELLTRLVSEDYGPAYIRLGRGSDTSNDYEPIIGQGVKIKSGKDITIIATGPYVHDIYSLSDKLAEDGIDIEIINIHTIKPLDSKMIIESAKKSKKVIVIEEHQVTGGLGDAVASLFVENKLQVELIKMGIEDKFCSYVGTYNGIRNKYNLGIDKIMENIYTLSGIKRTFQE